MKKHDHPDSSVVALKEATIAHGSQIIRVDAEKRNNGSEKAKLDISHPNARRRAFQYFLKVDTRESTAEASAEQSDETDELFVGAVVIIEGFFVVTWPLINDETIRFSRNFTLEK
jgi:dihydropteroate synthase